VCAVSTVSFEGECGGLGLLHADLADPAHHQPHESLSMVAKRLCSTQWVAAREQTGATRLLRLDHSVGGVGWGG